MTRTSVVNCHALKMLTLSSLISEDFPSNLCCKGRFHTLVREDLLVLALREGSKISEDKIPTNGRLISIHLQYWEVLPVLGEEFAGPEAGLGSQSSAEPLGFCTTFHQQAFYNVKRSAKPSLQHSGEPLGARTRALRTGFFSSHFCHSAPAAYQHPAT